MKTIPTILAFLAVAAMALAAPARAQGVKILYGFVPGSAGDSLSRVMAEKLQPALGQSVIVENRAGASGKIALRAVKAAAPDGANLVVTPSGPMTILPLHDATTGYDPEADFAPISQLVTFEFCLAISKEIPAKNLEELTAWLKKNPAKGLYGTSGAGTSMHFLGLKLAEATGVELRPVHYRGSALAVADLVAGQLPMAVLLVSDLMEQHKSGAVRVLATSNVERSIFLPDVPTFTEQNINVQAAGWYAAYAPSKTPAESVARLSKIMADSVQSPDVRQRLLGMGFKATGTTRETLARIQKSELDFWRPIVKASGFKTEE